MTNIFAGVSQLRTFIHNFELWKVAKCHFALDYFWCTCSHMKLSSVAFKDFPIPGWEMCSLSWLIWKDPDAGKDWRYEEWTYLCGLKAGERDDRGWDGWMASPTQWTRDWVNSRSWWWAGRPGMLQFMGSQKVGHDWATELNWTEEPTNAILLSQLTLLALQTPSSIKSL